MFTQPWEDAYHELWSHAVHHRGLREAVGELPGHMLSPTLRQWPRTRGADVVAIAAIVDPVLRAAPLESGGYGVERTWRRCAGELAHVALDDPAREYRHNRTFWSALASAMAYLASVDAPVPEVMWPALLDEVAAADPAHRSTAVFDEKLYLAAFSYDELWQAQKAALAKLRGADVREAPPGVMGGRMAIPRTTNADVLQLSIYWTDAISKVELQRRELGPEGLHALHAAGLDGEIRRWRSVLIGLDNDATAKDPAAIYPHNEALWRGSASLAVTLAGIDDAPPPFEMLLESFLQRPNSEHRNATYPGEGSFETMWDKQHTDFVEARGFDPTEGGAGPVRRPMKIPRTLNAEILKLAAYWDAAWKHLESRRGVFGSLPNEQGLDGLKKRWHEVMNNVGEVAAPGKVDAVYAKNNEFWREAFDLAQTLDLFNELPSKFDIAIDVAGTLPDRFANVVGQIAHAVGDIAHKAGEGVTSGLGKPILIGGSVILGGLLLWRWTRPKPRAAGAA